MNSNDDKPTVRPACLGARVRRLALLASLAATASACSASDPIEGTWVAPEESTPLPPPIDETLHIDATLILDASTASPTFDLHMDLEASSLTDVIDVHGTYARAGERLTLTVVDFDIDPASGNTSSVAEDGSRCIVLQGFGEASVCFPTPQTNPWSIEGDSLTIVLENAILGTAAPTTLTFTRAS